MPKPKTDRGKQWISKFRSKFTLAQHAKARELLAIHQYKFTSVSYPPGLKTYKMNAGTGELFCIVPEAIPSMPDYMKINFIKSGVDHENGHLIERNSIVRSANKITDKSFTGGRNVRYLHSLHNILIDISHERVQALHYPISGQHFYVFWSNIEEYCWKKVGDPNIVLDGKTGIELPPEVLAASEELKQCNVLLRYIILHSRNLEALSFDVPDVFKHSWDKIKNEIISVCLKESDAEVILSPAVQLYDLIMKDCPNLNQVMQKYQNMKVKVMKIKGMPQGMPMPLPEENQIDWDLIDPENVEEEEIDFEDFLEQMGQSREEFQSQMVKNSNSNDFKKQMDEAEKPKKPLNGKIPHHKTKEDNDPEKNTQDGDKSGSKETQAKAKKGQEKSQEGQEQEEGQGQQQAGKSADGDGEGQQPQNIKQAKEAQDKANRENSGKGDTQWTNIDCTQAGQAPDEAGPWEKYDYTSDETFEAPIHQGEGGKRVITDFDIIEYAKKCPENYYEAEKGITSFSKLRTILKKKLLSQEKHKIKRNLFSGRIDSKKLVRLETCEASEVAIFKKIIKSKSFKRTKVSLVIDESGSMHSDYKYYHARRAAILFAKVLDGLRIDFEVLGFTTCGSRGRFPSSVNRHESIHHIIYKEFGQRYIKEKLGGISANSCNVDGESLFWAACRLIRQRADRRIIFIFSDGHPNASCSYDMQKDLRMTVGMCLNSKIEVYGIGIKDNSVKQFYPDWMVIDDIENLPQEFFDKLSEVLAKTRH